MPLARSEVGKISVALAAMRLKNSRRDGELAEGGRTCFFSPSLLGRSWAGKQPSENLLAAG